MWVCPDIAGVVTAIKISTSLRSGFVDSASPLGGDMGASIIDEWQDRSVIEENTSMAGAAGPFAFDAGER